MEASEFLFFGSAEEASNDVNTFLNLRFIKKQNRNQLFLRKYYMLTSSKLRRFHWMYLTLCRKQYLAELEKTFLRFRKVFEVPKIFWKIKKYLQSVTKYLRLTLVFTWSSALREKSNFYFSRVFLPELTKVSFSRGYCTIE